MLPISTIKPKLRCKTQLAHTARTYSSQQLEKHRSKSSCSEYIAGKSDEPSAHLTTPAQQRTLHTLRTRDGRPEVEVLQRAVLYRPMPATGGGYGEQLYYGCELREKLGYFRCDAVNDAIYDAVNEKGLNLLGLGLMKECVVCV